MKISIHEIIVEEVVLRVAQSRLIRSAGLIARFYKKSAWTKVSPAVISIMDEIETILDLSSLVISKGLG